MAWKLWSDAFWCYRKKGMDLSDAAYRADQWEERKKREVAPPENVPRPKNPPRPKTRGQVA